MALHFPSAKEAEVGWMGFEVDFAGVAGRFTIYHQSCGGGLGFIQFDQGLVEKMPERKMGERSEFLMFRIILHLQVQSLTYSVFLLSNFVGLAVSSVGLAMNRNIFKIMIIHSLA